MTQARVPDAQTLDAPGIAPDSRGGFVAPLIVAAVSLGFAIQLHDGEYSPGAIALLTLALLAAIWAVAGGRSRWSAPGDRVTHAFLAGGVAVQLAALFAAWPGVDLPAAHSLLAFRILLGGAAVCLAWPRAAPGFAGFLLLFLCLGCWMVRSSPAPHIDVWMFQQDAARELLHGHNPYRMTFPDPYHSTWPGHQQVYGAGLVVNDRLQFGFPYPPVTLLLSALGYAVGGDFRFAQVGALVVAGVLMGFSAAGRGAKLAAALMLLTPRVFLVIGRGWTEPYAVMLLAATVFLACRGSRWLPLMMGLFLATKQYLVLAVPLTFFLLPSGWRWRDWAGLLLESWLVAAAVTLPFAAADWNAFWKSTITVQQLAPFRWDALSYIVWWGFHGHGEQVKLAGYALLPSLVAALVALGLSLWRSPRTPAGFAASLALLSLAFFAFNKQAFCNYYFFVIGALCCATAAAKCDPRQSPGDRTQAMPPHG